MAADGVTVAVERGAALAPLLGALARLRVTVFRAWPYLYDGSEAYEADYLQTYVKAPGAAVAVARDGASVVGASTCLPMAEASADARAPFLAAGLSLADFFYFGESVLLDAYRGQGIGVRFFELREAHALALGQARFCTFCAVQRAADDPRRPPGAIGLDGFWAHRGYVKHPAFTARMRWKDVDEAGETPKTLTFWMKSLFGDALPPGLLRRPGRLNTGPQP
jgi:GNAT superfamily N-acetyltransferase